MSDWRLILALAAALFIGCGGGGPAADNDASTSWSGDDPDPDPEPVDETDSTTSSGSSEASTAAPECSMLPPLEGEGPWVFDPPQTGYVDLSCARPDVEDVSHLFVAPQRGTYTFRVSAIGSVWTAVAVLDGDCGWTELACGTDMGDPAVAFASVFLEAGQEVSVVAEAASLDELGAITLSLVTELLSGDCPDASLDGPLPIQVEASTDAADNTEFGSCGGVFAPDALYSFEAPEDGVYVFDTDGSSMDTVLYVKESCGGRELVCNDDDDRGHDSSQVRVALQQGESVVVGVDGHDAERGAYRLSVNRSFCPNVVLESDVEVSYAGTNAVQLNEWMGTCGGETGPETTFSFTAPVAGAYVLDTDGVGLTTVIYTSDECGGEVTGCGESEALQVQLEEGQTIIITVDSRGAEGREFELEIDYLQCPDYEIGSVVPSIFEGQLSTFVTNESSGSCGGAGSNERVHHFVAPADGRYSISATTSFGGSLLTYVRDGLECGDAAEELLCTHTGAGLVDLVAGQSILVVVEGNSGPYRLVVDRPECGDGVVEVGELCEPSQPPPSCFSAGEGGGPSIVSCNDDCTFDTSTCVSTCNNGFLQLGEHCDLGELSGARCSDFGFVGGALGCDDCSFDLSQCSNDVVVFCSEPEVGEPVLGVHSLIVPSTGTIADVDVWVEMDYDSLEDFQLRLTANGLGVQNVLFSDACEGSNVEAMFNDEGDFHAGAGCAGPIAMEGNVIPLQALSVFDGGDPLGLWTLLASDSTPGSGSVTSWCLSFTLE